MRRGFATILLVGLIALFAILGTTIYLKQNNKLPTFNKSANQSSLQSSPTPTPDDTVYPDLIGANWKTYKSKTLGFEFMYPENKKIEGPYFPEENGQEVILRGWRQIDLQITKNRNNFIDYKVLKPCAEYTNEEKSTISITCLFDPDSRYYPQDELIKEIEVDGVRAVSFYPATFSEGSPPHVVQTITEPLIQISLYNDQILSTFKFVE